MLSNRVTCRLYCRASYLHAHRVSWGLVTMGAVNNNTMPAVYSPTIVLGAFLAARFARMSSIKGVMIAGITPPEAAKERN